MIGTPPVQTRVADALAAAGGVPRSETPTRWCVTFEPFDLPPLDIRLLDGWLALEVALGDPGFPPSGREGLIRGFSLPGPAKLCASSTHPCGATARVDLALGGNAARESCDEMSLSERLLEAVSSLSRARAAWQAETVETALAEEFTEERNDLISRIDEDLLGRPVHKRGETPVVDLGLRTGFYQAELNALAAGEVQAVVEIAIFESPSDVSVEALWRILVAANGRLMLVRASVSNGDEKLMVCFNARTGRCGTAQELEQVLSALEAACELGGREIAAIGNPELAAAYLDVTRSPVPVGT